MSGTDFRETAKTYTAFISSSLKELWELSRTSDPYTYYRGIRSFVIFLPIEIKDGYKDKDETFLGVETEIQRIDTELNRIRQTQHIDTYWMRRRGNDAMMRVCMNNNDRLMDAICRALDKRGYMERRGPAIPQGLELGT